MSEERNYPTDVVRTALERHLQDARSATGQRWLADVIALLAREAAAIQPPVERTDTLREYIYPH